MEQPGPASDAHTMEGSEVKSASEGSPLESQLHDATANVENEEQTSNKAADEAESYSQVKDEALSESGLKETTTDVETDTACGQEQMGGRAMDADTGCDGSTLSEEGGIPSFSKEAGGGVAASLDDVVESSPSVLEGTIQTSLTIDEAKVPQATAANHSEDPSSASVTNCPTEPSLVDDNGPAESPSPSSVQSTSKNSPAESTTTTTTSGISNGPSTSGSDTVSSSPVSSPQTSAKVSAPSHSLSSPFDTDCSRKLISQIQRSLSQESLLDELESELLDCQLPEGDGDSESERKGSPPVNGLPADQKDCMVVFEKCVQYKYAQQEKAIQR